MGTSPFSISIDEGSIKGNTEFLAVSSTYFKDQGSIETQTKLIGLIELEGSRTGETLYDKITQLLFSGERGEMRKKNMMGVASDVASNMISTKSAGVTNRFQNDYPYIIVSHDFCHILSLVIKYSLKEFPKKYVSIVNKISKKFSQSIQNSYRLKQLILEKYSTIDSKAVTIPRIVKTRWSSFYLCLERIIGLAEPLKDFFSEFGTQEEQLYLNNHNQSRLRLLCCILEKLNGYILKFQSEDMSILNVIKELKESLLIFSIYVLDVKEKKHYTDRMDFFKVTKNILKEGDKNAVYKEALRKLESFKEYFLLRHSEFSCSGDEKDNLELLKVAQSLFMAVVKQMGARLPLEDDGILIADGFSLEGDSSIDKLRQLGKRFSNIINPRTELSKLSGEIDKLELNLNDIQSHNQSNASKNWLLTWESNRNSYPLLYRLARAIQTLPYSTVKIERCFSIATDVKTIKRNNLSSGSLQACLLAKQEFKDKNIPLLPIFINRYENPVPKVTLITNISVNNSQVNNVILKEIEEDHPFIHDKTEKRIPNENMPKDKTTKFLEILGAATLKLIEKFKDNSGDLEIAETESKRLVGSDNPFKKSPPSIIIRDDLKHIKYEKEIPIIKEDPEDSDTEIQKQEKSEQEFDFESFSD